MRRTTRFADDETNYLLNMLSDPTTLPETYRDTMTKLGRRMAAGVIKSANLDKMDNICVVCTVEDADFLAKGLIDGIQAEGVEADRVKLICFWNERVHSFNDISQKLFEVAPIIKEYREELSLEKSVLVVVKSIISGACVVKTNLAALIESSLPKRVIVAAPVMLEGAEERLASEFSTDTASLFEYLTFAIDTEKGEDDNVIPGIGGSVYERLGFDDKNGYVPNIVKSRRLTAINP